MRLKGLIKDFPFEIYLGHGAVEDELEVRSISIDSRKVAGPCLFIALKGTRTDGCNYVADAVARGANVVLLSEDCFQKIDKALLKNVVVLVTHQLERAAGEIVSRFFGNPSKRLKVIGITGTNGKTTCSALLESIINFSGTKTAVSGTINRKIGTEIMPSRLTTPDLVEFHSFLKKALDQGCTHVITEVSSHALHQGRTEGCKFDIAVFTNLTHDHLDYHKDFEEYFLAKARLFTHFAPRFSVINTDDPYGQRLISMTKPDGLITYGIANRADLFPLDFSISLEGTKARIQTRNSAQLEIFSSLPGRHNLYNILAAIGASLALEIPLKAIKRGIEALKKIPGRLEPVFRQGIFGFVDYAHTPDALENILACLDELREENHRIITVIGCGGDRDRAKRPKMGDIASRCSDLAIFTSDNPRTEEPDAIASEMLSGVGPESRDKVRVILDRSLAIRFAAGVAEKGDIVLVAGKGHEDYQIIGEKRRQFSDVEELDRALSQKVYDNPNGYPTLWCLKEAINGEPNQKGFKDVPIKGVSTDSRLLKEGDAFFALKGERFDGHSFVESVFEKGAAVAVVNSEYVSNDLLAHLNLIKVEDTLRALGNYASWYRSFLGMETVCITGSCGKTTTKELCGAVVQKAYKALVTKGNLNNLIGVPLTIFEATFGTRLAVLELGTNQPGEIKRLCQIARPKIGLITCIKPVHLEGLGTLEGVSHEKGYLFEMLPEDGTAIVNADDPLVVKNLDRAVVKNIVAYGKHIDVIRKISPNIAIFLKNIEQNENGLKVFAEIDGKIHIFNSQLFGTINASNILAAVSVGMCLGIPLEAIKDAIQQVVPTKGRMWCQTLKGGWTLIDDSYNANPASMAAALEFLDKNFHDHKKNLIIGDMLELGEESSRFHKEIGQKAGILNPDILIIVGQWAEEIKAGANLVGFPQHKIKTFENVTRAKEYLEADQGEFFNGIPRVVLLKASRGVGLDQLAEVIRQRAQEAS